MDRAVTCGVFSTTLKHSLPCIYTPTHSFQLFKSKIFEPLCLYQNEHKSVPLVVKGVQTKFTVNIINIFLSHVVAIPKSLIKIYYIPFIRTQTFDSYGSLQICEPQTNPVLTKYNVLMHPLITCLNFCEIYGDFQDLFLTWLRRKVDISIVWRYEPF